MDAVGHHAEPLDKWQREAWNKSGLDGGPDFVFLLRIDGDVVTYLLTGERANGAGVMDKAHASLPRPDKNGVISR